MSQVIPKKSEILLRVIHHSILREKVPINMISFVAIEMWTLGTTE